LLDGNTDALRFSTVIPMHDASTLSMRALQQASAGAASAGTHARSMCAG
jgi:hypothetical protein